MSDRKNKRVIFICGAGHSGSTLLGMVLGSYSGAIYCGEMKKTMYLVNPDAPERKKKCQVCGKDCEIWGDYPFNDYSDLYEAVSARSNKEIVIDSTKNIEWITKSMNILSDKDVHIYLIFLKRDGRAVVNSRMRKYSSHPIEKIINDWKTQVDQTIKFYDNFVGNKTVLQYEEFCIEPEKKTREICDFLNISYNPEMLDFTSRRHHPLGGNSGTSFLVRKKQEDSSLTHSEEFYRENKGVIKLDLRWKKEIPVDLLDLFKKEASAINESFKFEG